MTTTRLIALVGALAVLGCGEGEPAAPRPASPFAGAWIGTKTYQTTTGEWLASVPDWPFAIEVREDGTVGFVNGPALAPIDAATATVLPHAYPAVPTPGPPGHCVPVAAAIHRGTVTLTSPDALVAELLWTQSCGGDTGVHVAVYDMARVPALPASTFSQL